MINERKIEQIFLIRFSSKGNCSFIIEKLTKSPHWLILFFFFFSFVRVKNCIGVEQGVGDRGGTVISLNGR